MTGIFLNKFNPKVSIVIPVYNGSNFLKEAIDSALAQTYKNIEIIVVNDGSNDNSATEKIAKSYGNKIRYFKKENGGVATALNLGIEKMTGEYFSWLSHDDMYYPGKIKKQIKFLSKHKDKNVILYSNYDLIDECGKRFDSITFDKNMLREKPIYSILRGCVNGITTLVPVGAFKKHGKFDTSLRYTQDYDMWFRLFNNGYKFIHMGLILSKTRIHGNQDTVMAPNVLEECNVLWINMIKSIPDSHKEQLELSLYSFYVEMIKFLKNTKYSGATKYCSDQLKELDKKIIEDIKKAKTKVTIITPTYNRADYIKLTMKSVLKQGYKNYTYIILDDGSNDDTNKVVSNFIKDKKNWFYLYHDNMGEPATANKGWQLCYSEYFIQVNSDDLIEPSLFDEMVTILDENPKSVLSYPDFYIINENGKIIDDTPNSDSDFIKDLSMFSCYAACPGAFVRKTAFKDWKDIRDKKYRYISDVDMLWKMALKGDFIHVPIFLASWRSHAGGVSVDRYKSIEEIKVWVEEYFSQKKLPKIVKDIELECRRSLNNYYASLMLQSDLNYKIDASNYYKEKAKLPIPRYSNLQVGDNDLMGNKFNGHNLHINLRNRGVDSCHLVLNKQSNDPNTYLIGGDKITRDRIRTQAVQNQSLYDLDNINNPLMWDVLYNRLFLDADVVHLHLMHNGVLDLSLLPVMSKIKPIIWTIHDTWAVLGDSDYSAKPEYRFPSTIKNIPLNYHFKKESIMDSDIKFVVASKYMKNVLENSEIFKGKEIYHVPFGLDLGIFYPRDKNLSKKGLGIDPSDFVILARGNIRDTKGLDYVEYVLDKLGPKHNIHLLVVGGNDLVGLPDCIKMTNFGWVESDDLLAKIYSASDILLMPSAREAFGMMAIEAMACGSVPVVINGTALPETVNAPFCGVSTDRDMKTYCDAVEYLLQNPSERINKAKRCVKYINENHNTEKYLNSIEKVYRNAMESHKIDGYYKNIASEIRNNNMTEPRLTVALPQYNNRYNHRLGSITRIRFRIKDIIFRFVKNLKNVGFKNTVKKATRKIGDKIQKYRLRT